MAECVQASDGSSDGRGATLELLRRYEGSLKSRVKNPDLVVATDRWTLRKLGYCSCPRVNK